MFIQLMEESSSAHMWNELWKISVKFVLCARRKNMRVCESVNRFIPNFATIFMGVVSFKHRPFYRRAELSL